MQGERVRQVCWGGGKEGCGGVGSNEGRGKREEVREES